MTDTTTLNPSAFEGISGPIHTVVTPMALSRHGKLLPDRQEDHRTKLAMAIPMYEFYTEVVPALNLVQRMRKLGSICYHTIEIHGDKTMLRRKCSGDLYDTHMPADLLGCICSGCSRVIALTEQVFEDTDTEENDDDA